MKAKILFVFVLLFSSAARAQDWAFCEQIRPGESGRPCPGDPNGRNPGGGGDDKNGNGIPDSEEKDDVVCFSYGSDTEGESSTVSAGENQGNNENPLKSLGGCFQGLGNYFGGGQFASDLKNAPGSISKGWKSFLDTAQEKVWRPFEKAVNKIFGGGDSDNGEAEAQIAQMNNFISSREKDRDAVDRGVNKSAFEWKMGANLTGSIGTEISQGSEAHEAMIQEMTDEIGGGAEGIPFYKVNSDYPFGTKIYTPEGKKLYNAQNHYNYAKEKLSTYVGPDLPVKQNLLDNSEALMHLADQSYQDRDFLFGDRAIAIARHSVDMALGMVPVVSFGLDAWAIATGYNFVTGEQVSDVEKGIMLGTLFLPSVIGGSVEVIAKLSVKMARVAERPAVMRMVNTIRNAEQELAPRLGKTPCISYRDRKISPYRRVLEFFIPVAYGCVHLGGITDEFVAAARKSGLKTTDEIIDLNRLTEKAAIGNTEEFLNSAAKSASGKPILFNSQRAVEHFEKHQREMAVAFDKGNYSMRDYLYDANTVVKEGVYAKELNAYVKILGGPGEAKAGFVGLTRDGERMTTFHIKYVKHLKKDAPSLGWE